MPINRPLRIAAVLLLAVAPAFAADGPRAADGTGGAGVNKDMVQLQTQVQQLLDAVARLQQSNDERMGVLKDLVQQSADSVNRMSVTVNALEKQFATQQAATGAKVDQVSGQVQAINDSVDEVKARLNRLEKILGNIDSQQQSMSAAIQNLQPPPPAPGTAVPNAMPDASAIPGTPTTGVPPIAAATTPSRPGALPPATVRPISKPLVDDLYKAAYSDYMAARNAVAVSEFGDVIKNYPDAQLAGNSYFYLGEIDYHAGKFAAAAKDYDHVLEQFPDNQKIPVAHLHKGEALLQLKETQAGITELRALIQRFPASPEAQQARTKLNGMGVPIKPRS